MITEPKGTSKKGPSTMTKMESFLEARAIESYRSAYRRGETPRYIIACGMEISGKVQVRDAAGGWVCSRHKSLALAEKRAAELNASVVA